MKILIIDNYDSFTYNLVQYLQEITDDKVSIFRNDAISVEDVDNYDCIVLSPGPGIPKDAGNMPAIIHAYKNKKPILGVCLGHQAIGEAFGGKLENLEQVYHGLATDIYVSDKEEPLYQNLPDTIEVGRYHSWVIDKDHCPDCLLVTSISPDGAIMSIRHESLPIFGVQYHPESIMTPEGKVILSNFLNAAKASLA
ncbi:MAG: anthranilate synthase component 2 [Maribacter sp.]|jgi:anthranilate synthase component 2